jgi:hypothetical protein
MFRHDEQRSASTETVMGDAIKQQWLRNFGGAISAPTIHAGTVYLSSLDTHVVYALNAADGATRWEYIADGVVDTPPTVYNGIIVFGTRSGTIYALLADTGELAWKQSVVPEKRFVVNEGRLESAWPVYGSVLVRAGKVYASAGRSSYLDGGIRIVVIDLPTGKVIESRDILSDYVEPPNWGRNPADDYGLLNDILAADKQGIYLRHRLVFGQEDRNTKWVGPIRSTAGTFDTSLNNRTFYLLDGTYAGLLAAHTEEKVYFTTPYPLEGSLKKLHFEPGHEGFHLHAYKRDADNPPEIDATAKMVSWKPPSKPLWHTSLKLVARSIICSKDILYVAGSPDRLDPVEPWAYYEGKRDGVLMAISTADGSVQNEYRLNNAPAYSGLAAANGQLYISLVDGTILSLNTKE